MFRSLAITVAAVLGFLAFCVFGVARAETPYDLIPGACGTNTYGTCDVYNDGTTVLSLSWNTNGTVKLSQLTLPGRVVVDTYSANIGSDPRDGISHAVLSDGANVADVSGTFATRRTCTGSGRGQHCTTYVTFLGGTATL